MERHRRGRAARARLRLRSRVQRSLGRARTARRRRRGGPRARPSGTQAAFRARHCWRASARPGAPRPRSPSRASRATRRRPAPSEPCSRSTGRIWPQRRSGSAGSSACSSWRRRRRRGSASRCSRSSSRASRARPWAASPSCSRPGSSRASSICRRSSSLWETSYGQALIAKSILLVCALVLGAVNTLRSRPRLVAAAQRRDQALGDNAAGLLRRLVLGEVALLAGAVVAASILTSIAPPSQALASAGKADGKVGPGRRGAHVHARRRAHPGRRRGPTAPRSTTPSRCVCSARAGPCATRASRPSSTCST